MLVAERGDETPIEWVHRDGRFGEKLATPDTSIADLIGEVDPIKVAEGPLPLRRADDPLRARAAHEPRHLRDQRAPRPRRAHPGRLCSTCSRSATCRSAATRSASRSTSCSLASANPEDYTNRGRIITPLKDRFGAQIRTHYPLETETRDRRSSNRRRARSRPKGSAVTVPEFMTEIVAEISQLARRSPHVNQRSGVSARLSIANYETLVANATRRALCAAASTRSCPASRDLDALAASTSGQDRDRDARRRPRGPGARAHHEGRGARGVPGPSAGPRSSADVVRVVRGRLGRAHRRGRPVGRVRRACSSELDGIGAGARRPRGRRDARPASRPRSSSCSKACTSRSASTRTPSAAAPPTAAADRSFSTHYDR